VKAGKFGVMPVPITLETLKCETAAQRWQRYQNAMRRPGDPESKRLIALIDDNELSLREGGGLPAEHPLIRAIRDICHSPEGVAAGIEATEDGLPALAYVDPIIRERLPAYVVQRDSHSWAGTYMAEAMEHAGYRRTGRRGQLPPGSGAETAMIFERRR
jgi:hypothetical protein